MCAMQWISQSSDQRFGHPALPGVSVLERDIYYIVQVEFK